MSPVHPNTPRPFSVALSLRSPEVRKTHSPAPIVPPKADPPSKNVEIGPKDPSSNTVKLAKELRRRAGRATETYVAYGVTEKLYKECARQADYSVPQAKDKAVPVPKTNTGVDLGVGDGWWYKELGLTPTFNTWAQITMLHLYLLATRIRCFPSAHAPAWQQHLLDHFFYDAEQRMIDYHGMDARGVRNRYLKDLFVQYRGALAAYDEGLCKGDAVLAAAMWRNVFGGDGEMDLRGLGMVVAYVRRAISRLERLSDEEVVAGALDFGDPAQLRSVVEKRSKLLDEPFTEEDFEAYGAGDGAGGR
ncbi:MAG: Protein cbp3, mitochondrial [Thelocarpon impressellum]|nr:MAG: Protein cbp3, mitochondrial [Thelocarpon impressellum]